MAVAFPSERQFSRERERERSQTKAALHCIALPSLQLIYIGMHTIPSLVQIQIRLETQKQTQTQTH